MEDGCVLGVGAAGRSGSTPGRVKNYLLITPENPLKPLKRWWFWWDRFTVAAASAAGKAIGDGIDYGRRGRKGGGSGAKHFFPPPGDSGCNSATLTCLLGNCAILGATKVQQG